jgi:hypothetical protein
MHPEAASRLLHVSPAAVWAWTLRGGLIEAGGAQRFADVEAALAAARGLSVHIGLAGRLLHTEVVGPGRSDPGPDEPAVPARALAAARSRWIQRLGPEAAGWPLALGAAEIVGSATIPSRVVVAWFGRIGPDLAPAAQLERWQAAARRAGVRLASVAPWWALWMAADPRPRGVRLWAERDGAMLHLTRIEADGQGLHAVRQRRWPLRPAESVAAALARLAVEDGAELPTAAGWIGGEPADPDALAAPPRLGREPNGAGSASAALHSPSSRPASRLEAAPDFLRPLGPPTPWPRMARMLVALAGVAALAALADLAFALQRWRGAGAELAQWQQLERRHGQRRASEPSPGLAAPSVPSAGSARSRTREAEARRAAWAVQRELEHPWAAMGTAWQAGPAQDRSLRWLALEHSQPVAAHGTAAPAGALWRASAQVRRPEDAIAVADALGAAAPWQSVRVQRLEPLADAVAWRFELHALWPLAAVSAGSVR